MGQLVAGVDCSTQSTKVVIVDIDVGSIVAMGSAEHEVTGTGGARETDPAVWWRALTAALAETGRAGDVAAISVAGQQHGLVAQDASGIPVRPALLWNDTRAATDAAQLITALGGREAWAERIGVVPVASFTVAHWAWMRRVEPETAGRVAAIRLPHDHLTERLTGEGVTDRGDASGTGWWSTATEAYAPDVLALPSVELDRGLLPRVLRPDEKAGQVLAGVAAELGLRAGIPVGPGTGDNMAAALGLGVPSGVPVISLGTSGTAFMVAADRAADPTGIVAGFADATGRFLPLACTLNCTQAVDRVAGWFGLDRDDVRASDGVVVLPWFDGERTPDLPDATASIVGVGGDVDPRSILMATYEGALIGLLDALEMVGACGGGIADGAPLVLVGGGARGTVWQEAVARLSGRTVQVPEPDEYVAIGGAAQAAAVLTGESVGGIAIRWASGRAGRVIEATHRDAATIDRYREAREAGAQVARLDAPVR